MVKSHSHKKCKLKMNFSLAHWKELKRMLQIPVNEDMEKQTCIRPQWECNCTASLGHNFRICP